MIWKRDKYITYLVPFFYRQGKYAKKTEKIHQGKKRE